MANQTGKKYEYTNIKNYFKEVRYPKDISDIYSDFDAWLGVTNPKVKMLEASLTMRTDEDHNLYVTYKLVQKDN